MILMRHGESEFNVVYGATRRDPGIVDPVLTETGREQVAAAASQLALEGRIRILSSPYRRALETAEIVAAVLGLPVTVDPLIGERAYFTCDIGSAASQLRRRWPDFDFGPLNERWWPGPEESEAALHSRCARFRGRLREEGGWQGLLVVTHWGFIRGLTGEAVTNAALVAFDPERPAPETLAPYPT